MVEVLTKENFESTLDKQALLFIDFWADWCAPCHMFKKIFEKVAEGNPEVSFASVDVENETELAASLQISSVPHLVVFKEGIAIYSEAGSLTESALLEILEQAKACDIETVKASISQE